jgi:hypothetical protein
MKKLVIISILLVVLMAGLLSFLVLEREAAHREEADKPCLRERLLLDVWRTQDLIMAVEQRGTDIVVVVSRRPWKKITRTQQVGIAKAAFCLATELQGQGEAIVSDSDGTQLGRVERGKWVSTLYPD